MKKVTMATTGYVSGGASSSRGSVYRSDRTNDYRPNHCSSGLLTLTIFFGKTREMNSKIIDVGSRQGDRFLSKQDYLPDSAIDQPTSQNIDTPADDICVVVITPPKNNPPKHLVLVRVNTTVGGAKF